VLVDVQRDKGLKVAGDTGAVFYEIDVSHFEAVQSLIEAVLIDHGQLDIVVSNACVHRYGSLDATSPEILDEVLDNNLKPTYYLAKCSLPHVTKSAGSIIIIASGQGSRAFANSSAYGWQKEVSWH